MASISDISSQLSIVISLRDLATSGLREFTDNFARVQEKISKAGKKIFDVGKDLSVLGSSPLGLAKNAISMATDFDDSMRKVAATVGQPYEAIDGLIAKAQEMGNTTRFTSSQAADALNYMAMAGWSSQQMMDGIAGVMNLAAASGEDLATTSDIVTDALTAFNLTAADSNHFADVLAQTARSANTNVSMMGASFKYVAPTAGALGYSIEDVSVALGIMANSGIKADTAGTTLRSTLARMASPTTAISKTMDVLGLSLTDASGKMKPLNQLLGEMRTAFAQLTPEQKASYASTIAGKEAMSGFLALVNASDSDFTALREAISNSGGVAQEMADTMEGGLGGALRIVQSLTENLQIAIGDSFKDSLQKTSEALQPLVDKLTEFVKNNPEAVSTILGLTAALGVVGGAFMFAAPIIQAFTVLFNPLGLAITLIVGAISLLALAWTSNWGGIQEKTQAVWETIRPIFDNIVAVIGNAWQWIQDNVLPFFDEMWSKVSGFFEEIQPLIDGAITNITGWIQDFFTTHQDKIDAFVATVRVAWEAIKTAIQIVWEAIKGIIQVAWNIVSGIIKTGLQILNGDWAGAWETIKSTFSQVWDTIWQTLQAVFGKIKDFFSRTLDDMKTIGKNLVEGLWHGIASMTGWIGEKISSFIGGIVDKFKDGFGIHSPSKIFAEMGQFNIAGLIEGMRDSLDNLEISGISATVVHDFRQGLDPQPAYALSSGGNSYSDSHNTTVTFTGDIIMNDGLDVESVGQYLAAQVANVVY